MTANSPSSHKKTSYKGVIIFATIAIFIYGAWSKLRVDLCLDGARDAYKQDWAAACKTTAKAEREGYANCMNITNEATSTCKTFLNPNPDASANCSLPTKIADRIDSRLEKEKNFCVKYG